MKKIKKNWRSLICICCVAAVVVSFSAGCSVGKNSRVDQIEKKASKITKLIDAFYLNDVDQDKVEANIYKGILNGLGDPYSVYYTADEFKQMQEETSGTYVGIGVTVTTDKDTGYLRVVSAFEEGSAYQAGVRADDYVTKVNGEDIQGQDSSTIVSKIKGEEGTTVDVTFIRKSTGDEFTYTLERKSIDVPTISHEMLDGDIGYIQISQFDEVTANQYFEALNELEEQGEKGLIVDVRDNPGGVLQTVVSMLQNMLPKGTIVYTEDKNGKKETYSGDGAHEFKKPLVVLVNGNSASASEIFTGAIKDYGIGTIVGTTTFGKGIVQKIYPLDDGSAVKLTISKYYTPNGVCIHEKGIEPDINIEYDKDAQGDTYSKEKDNQLQKAIEVIKKEI